MKKIFFKLIIEDNYPPVSEESIWGVDLGNNLFKINNIPFYSKDVSFDDTVSVVDIDGVLHYKKTIKSSGNSTIRIIFFDGKEIEDCINAIQKMGCDYEKFSSTFIAINIPITTNLEIVLDYLEYLSFKEIADYEYGKIVQ
ncbi:TPA: DUF4265 domain-containing protein [Neisseria subflava]|jgi:hypothetical protein|uniref:DUF4265 domain-containing protein n=1 Tax=unclassified Neisseria TaxID=2623750 RepID=UPI0008A21750|nr:MULTISPECIES: DUF4265 domain-containing protein [unclassified Neisseria]OFK87122.1 hypothetical protein HMPREF2797_07955 [Neisseria sp. HMSC061E12]OFP79018.1 hypothetical protein HMPREF2972_03300 [Neisseria sp. HMSC066B07]OHO82631.1 hypothetical protein HMPREF2567_09755 [Neisseria sp. HMSC056A04]OHQ29509.1 hypothetical protein HMPREF2669_04295 [Neisseria sp. HMSC066F04]OHR19720.1 hypothetical protein HMPREF2560_05485 [Neisseria sp. HMSC078H04]